jgi:hypothetical protein
MHHLIGELFPLSVAKTTTVHCNNQAALALSKDNNYHAHTKHIDIQYHFIRHTVSKKIIKLVYCPTDDMMADILTKALPCWKVACHTLGLRLRRPCGGVVKSGDSNDAGAPTEEKGGRSSHAHASE